MQTIFTILICILKHIGKTTDTQANFNKKVLYLQCLYYRTTSQLQNHMQNQSKV